MARHRSPAAFPRRRVAATVAVATTAASVLVHDAGTSTGEASASAAVETSSSLPAVTAAPATVAPASDRSEQVHAAALVKAAGLTAPKPAHQQVERQAPNPQPKAKPVVPTHGPVVSSSPQPVTGSGAGAAALRAALTRMGMPYQWGATGPSSFDCSGLMQWAFRQVGVSLPRATYGQVNVGSPVSQGNLQPGDLVFFYGGNSHVGIYAGGGKVLNAVDTGDVVRFSDMRWMPFNTARRI